MTILLLVFVVVVIVAVGIALVLLTLQRRERPDPAGLDGIPEDLLGLRQEVAALRAEVRGSLRQLGVVRYDAFSDVGGGLSWSVALLDDRGDGVVLTSIHGRSEARSYAKSIAGWTCEQQLSPEEQEAVTSAKARG